jgi:hypothetical protein
MLPAILAVVPTPILEKSLIQNDVDLDRLSFIGLIIVGKFGEIHADLKNSFNIGGSEG